jgi:hypothetical protein
MLDNLARQQSHLRSSVWSHFSQSKFACRNAGSELSCVICTGSCDRQSLRVGCVPDCACLRRARSPTSMASRATRRSRPTTCSLARDTSLRAADPAPGSPPRFPKRKDLQRSRRRAARGFSESYRFGDPHESVQHQLLHHRAGRFDSECLTQGSFRSRPGADCQCEHLGRC